MIVHSIPSLDLPNGFWTGLLGRRGKEEMEGRGRGRRKERRREGKRGNLF